MRHLKLLRSFNENVTVKVPRYQIDEAFYGAHREMLALRLLKVRGEVLWILRYCQLLWDHMPAKTLEGSP